LIPPEADGHDDVADVQRKIKIDGGRNPDVTALSHVMFVEDCKQLTLSEVRRALAIRRPKDERDICIPSLISYVVRAQEKVDERLANIRDNLEKMQLQVEHATKIFERVCRALSVASLLDHFRFGSIYFHPEKRPHKVLERFWVIAMTIFINAFLILR